MKAPPPAGLQPPVRDPDAARKASAYIAALGGKANIVRVDACAETRLRLVVRDETTFVKRRSNPRGLPKSSNWTGAKPSTSSPA